MFAFIAAPAQSAELTSKAAIQICSDAYAPRFEKTLTPSGSGYVELTPEQLDLVAAEYAERVQTMARSKGIVGRQELDSLASTCSSFAAGVATGMNVARQLNEQLSKRTR